MNWESFRFNQMDNQVDFDMRNALGSARIQKAQNAK